MDRLQDHMRKNIAQKFRGKQAIGAIVSNTAQSFFMTHNITIIQCYVRFTKCFLKLKNRHDQVRVHRLQTEFIQVVNKKLEKLGYQTNIDMILFK